MTSTYVYHVVLTGVFPPLTQHILFSDTWGAPPQTVSQDVVWDGSVPVSCDLSWETWMTAHHHVGHLLGSHHFTAIFYDSGEGQLSSVVATSNLQSSGSFDFGGEDPIDLPLGYTGWYVTPDYRAYRWPTTVPWTATPPTTPYVEWPDSYLDTIRLTGVSDVSGVTAWVNTGGSTTVVPIDYMAQLGLDWISIPNSVTPSVSTMVITGTDSGGSTSIPWTINIYEGYRWYLLSVYYTGMFNAVNGIINYDACTLFNDLLSSTTSTFITDFSVSPAAGWLFSDELGNDPTAGRAISSPYERARVIAAFPAGTPGSYVVDLNVTDNESNIETRSVSIEVASSVIEYADPQPTPGEFHFTIHTTASPNTAIAYAMEVGKAPPTNWSFLVSDNTNLVIDGGTMGPPSYTTDGSGLLSLDVIATPDETPTGDYDFNIIIYPSSAAGIAGVVQALPITVTA